MCILQNAEITAIMVNPIKIEFYTMCSWILISLNLRPPPSSAPSHMFNISEPTTKPKEKKKYTHIKRRVASEFIFDKVEETKK